ncbi:MAG: efflux transporter outer membrane subunit [Planctomycetota bacterium]|jgi:NodT family efflux transporter outer membrane factor (OMF) lipoprotein
MTRGAYGLCLAAALLCGGCLFGGPGLPEPPVGLPDAFTKTGQGELPDEWWTVLGDADLEALIGEALSGNMTLRGMWDRLEQARAVAAKEGAALLPDLEGTAGASRTVSENETTGTGDREYVSSTSLGLAAGYELDLWGRVRSGRKAAVLDALASDQDLRAAAMSLSAAVAGSWYRLVELRGQLELLDKQIKTNSDYLETVTLRFRRGQVPAVDVLQQRQILESVRGDRAVVQSFLQVEMNRLAVLLGRAPGAYTAPEGGGLPALPPLPATGTPAEWVQKRPDIQAAFLRVQAADHRVAAAIADRFPRVMLFASADTTAEEVRDIFDNWLATIAASLVAPLFDGWRREAEVERAQAAASERLHDFGEVLLDSLEEVENALVQEERQQEYVGSLEKQLELSRQSVEQTISGYKKGTTDFTRLLTTLLTHQRLERTVLLAKRELVLFRIALYRALAGGWKPPHPDGQEDGEEDDTR